MQGLRTREGTRGGKKKEMRRMKREMRRKTQRGMAAHVSKGHM